MKKRKILKGVRERRHYIKKQTKISNTIDFFFFVRSNANERTVEQKCLKKMRGNKDFCETCKAGKIYHLRNHIQEVLREVV